MLLLMTLFACEEQKTYFYDVSSTVFVTNEEGSAVEADDVKICQYFQSEDYDTRTAWEVSSEQCNQVNIQNGVAIIPNWEGEYFGNDVSIQLELNYGDEVFLAEIIDSDSEVWCDNEEVTDVDEYGNPISYESVCVENYERYLLWSLVVPAEIF